MYLQTRGFTMNVLLMGGGMDSYAVLLYLVEKGVKVVCVHVDYGQTSAKAERAACKGQISYVKDKYKVPLDLVELDDKFLIYHLNPHGSYLFGHETASPELKGRNLVLFLRAVCVAGYNGRIYLGLDKPYNGGEPFKDCVLPFFKDAIKMIDRPDIEVIAPFINMDKQNVVTWAYHRDSEFLDRTMSCWDARLDKYDDVVECGVCKHCKTKKELKEGLAHV